MCENIALGGGGSHVVKNSIADSLAFFSTYAVHHCAVVLVHLDLCCFALQSLQYLFLNCKRKKKEKKYYNAIACFLANTTNIEFNYLQCHCMFLGKYDKH